MIKSVFCLIEHNQMYVEKLLYKFTKFLSRFIKLKIVKIMQ